MTLVLKSSAAVLAAICTVSLAAQTSSPTHHTGSAATRRSTPATHSSSADHPPGVPPVHGLPKVLYALRYIDISVGSGALAESRKYYTVRYTGWTTDGKKFDSSDDHPGQEPITFPYGAHRVIAGWDTGFQGMHVGGKRRLFVPYQLAYGEQGRPPQIPAKADLIFDVELVAQSDTPPTPPAAPQPPPASSTLPKPGVPLPSGTPSSTQPSASPKPSPAPDGSAEPSH